MWVKICANTTLEDAVHAVQAGADALGFVFAPSKRLVTPSQVAAITANLPQTVEKVGVFTSSDAVEIVRSFRIAGLDTIQLHGGFDPELIRAIEDELPGVAIIQTVSWLVGGGADAEDTFARKLRQLARMPGNHRVLIDSKLGDSSGGTGVHFDWKQAKEALANVRGLRIIVAGGLTPENVAGAINILNPWGVDVASGVEQMPGRKDPQRVERFIQNARTASPQRLAVRAGV